MKILYLSFSDPDHVNNSVYIKGLRQNSVVVDPFRPAHKGILGYFESLKFYLKNRTSYDFIIVGHDSPTLVIFLRPFCRKKIIYYAILPVYDRLVVSRNLVKLWSLKGIYYWLIDFLAFHLSDLTGLETNQQIDFISKFYYISPRRLFRAFTGVDGDYFFHQPRVVKFERFTVIFRGAFLPEAGVQYAIQAAKLLENKDVNFIVIGTGMLKAEIERMVEKTRPQNLEFITEFLPFDKLTEIMQKSHLSLGQLSDHERLNRTIPNKAFESLALKLPYLTAANKGILELLTSDRTCLTCNPADAESLAEKILWIKNNYSFAEKVAQNGHNFYQSYLRSDILANNLLDKIKAI